MLNPNRTSYYRPSLYIIVRIRIFVRHRGVQR